MIHITICLQTASKRLSDGLRARRTGWLASDETTEELGLVKLPEELLAYVTSGAVYQVASGGSDETHAILKEAVGKEVGRSDVGWTKPPPPSHSVVLAFES